MMWDNLMHPSTLWLVSPIISLLINGLIQTLSYRFLKNLLLSEFVGFIVGLIAMIMMSTWIIYSYDLILLNYWAIVCVNLIIYIAMQIWFSNVLGLISVALRVRILQQIETNRGSTYEELLTVFSPNKLVQRRLDRLVKTEQIKEKEGKYYINKKFLLVVAHILDMGKLFLIGKKSEFD